MTTLSTSSMAYLKRGGRRIALRTEPKCRTCMHPRRRMIERLRLNGLTYTQISERLASVAPPSISSIRRHFERGHMPFDAASVVKRQDQRGEKLWTESAEAATVRAAEDYERARATVSAAYWAMRSGHLVPTIPEAIRAMALSQRQERFAEEARLAEEGERFGVASLLNVLNAVFEHLRDVAGDDVFVEVLDRTTAHPDVGDVWIHHSRLALLMRTYHSVDERRTYAYRNALRPRWSSIPRRKFVATTREGEHLHAIDEARGLRELADSPHAYGEAVPA